MALLDLNPHAMAVLLLTVIALYMFTRDRIPLETSSLFVWLSWLPALSFSHSHTREKHCMLSTFSRGSVMRPSWQ